MEVSTETLAETSTNWQTSITSDNPLLSQWLGHLKARKQTLEDLIAQHSEAGQAVRLALASKYCSPVQLLAAYKAGVRLFGENKVQGLLEKKAWLTLQLGPGQPSPEWHYIGTLQSNKVNKVVGEVSLIHSIDSVALAERVNRRAEALGLTQPVLTQVNISGEATKQGFEERELIEQAAHLASLPNLAWQGLMGMAAAEAPPEIVEKSFAQLSALRVTLCNKLQRKLPELSMGMSQDFPLACRQGATLLRLGSTWFNGFSPEDGKLAG